MNVEVGTTSVRNVVIAYLQAQLPWNEGRLIDMSELHMHLLRDANVVGSISSNSMQDRKTLWKMKTDEVSDVLDALEHMGMPRICPLRYPESTLLSIMNHVGSALNLEYTLPLNKRIELTPDMIIELNNQLENMKDR